MPSSDVGKARAVEIHGERVRQSVGNRLLLRGASRARAAHHPLIFRVGSVQIGDRAPAHHACHRVRNALHRADCLEIRVIQAAVARRAENRRLRAAAARAVYKDTLRVACRYIVAVAQIADGCFEVGNACGRAVIHAAAAGINIHHAVLNKFRHAFPHRLILGHRMRGSVEGRVNGYGDGSRGGGVAVHRRALVQLAGEGAVAVVGRVHVGGGNDDSQLLKVFIDGLFAIVDAELIIRLVLLVVLPLCHIGLGKIGFCLCCGGRRRGFGGCLGRRSTSDGIAAAARAQPCQTNGNNDCQCFF